MDYVSFLAGLNLGYLLPHTGKAASNTEAGSTSSVAAAAAIAVAATVMLLLHKQFLLVASLASAIELDCCSSSFAVQRVSLRFMVPLAANVCVCVCLDARVLSAMLAGQLLTLAAGHWSG